MPILRDIATTAGPEPELDRNIAFHYDQFYDQLLHLLAAEQLRLLHLRSLEVRWQ